MAVNIVTTEDLHTFRAQLLDDLKQIFTRGKPETPRQWLKSAEVRKLLKISPGTLQNLRINGTLKFTKLGSIHYYSLDDIQHLLESGFHKAPTSVAETYRTSFAEARTGTKSLSKS